MIKSMWGSSHYLSKNNNGLIPIDIIHPFVIKRKDD